MDMYGSFESKEDLLAAVGEEIAESKDENGKTTYRLVNKDAETYRAKYDAEVKNSQSQRAKKQELTQQLEAVEREYRATQEALEQLKSLKPEDMKAKIDAYVSEVGGYKKRISELESELTPLREKASEFETKERNATIEKELVDVARKFDVSENALRDVRRLASLFEVGKDGIVRTKGDDKRLVPEVLKEEFELSPHWQKRSQGAGAGPGSALPQQSQRTKYDEAKRGGDFLSMMQNAPNR